MPRGERRAGLRNEAVIDPVNDHYEVMSVGWQVVAFVCMGRSCIWTLSVERSGFNTTGTMIQMTDKELLAAGTPKERTLY